MLKNCGYLYKKICLNFQSIQDLLFLFSLYKMVDIMNICKSLNINTGTLMKNPDMLKFVPDQLKTNYLKMCKHAVQKFSFY